MKNLPPDASEPSLKKYFSQFGGILRAKVLIHKSLGFVEFACLEDAQKCCQAGAVDLLMDGRRLKINYSGRDSIEEDKNQGNEASRILLVTITNVKFPMTAEVVQAVFSKCGEVLRTVLFQRQQGEQALVEMETLEQAQVARKELDGKNVFLTSNCMQVSFSQQQSLQISQQNDRARDFTRPYLGEQQPNKAVEDEGILSKTEFMKLF